MKKVKIMLFSLALLAVVGGMLAFKARYNAFYCTSTYNQQANAPATCSVLVKSIKGQGITDFWTTPAIPTVDELGNNTFTCSSDFGQGVTYTGCLRTTTLTID